MNDPQFQKAYEAQNRADYVKNATVATLIQIPLNLGCSVMDHVMYPNQAWLFLKVRLCCAALVITAWLRFKLYASPSHQRFGIIWIICPLVMILWMIYVTDDPYSPYYAGLNIILLGMGLLTPWAYWQNLLVTLFVLVMYVVISLGVKKAHALGYLVNNTTFLAVTGAIVVSASVASGRQRLREFTLRYELGKNKRVMEVTNEKLSTQNLELAKANQETHAAEMQLVQSEKLASLGRFSAGLMHDVLNPLNYARTGTFTLRKKVRLLPPELKAEFEAILTDVEDGLKRVDNIVSDLRTFTHPGGQTAEDTDVAEVLSMALRFVSSEINDKNVRVETIVAPGQKAWISRNHMILVLVNLMENAIDALEEKNFSKSEARRIRITGEVKNGRSYLRLRDNGPGIDPKHLSKVFDPFYTTKDVGKGTGLGLSICFGIMHGYSGDITVTSERGKFCEFVLDLPCGRENVILTDHAEPIRL